MNEKLTRPYDPKNTEPRIYDLWEKSGYFNPDNCVKDHKTKPTAEPFAIVLPPPNVTGVLHMGSALMLVIEDIMVRHARMSGKRTLWIPGTDSAAIATQAVVEKEIQKKEGKSRYDLGREELLRRIDVFVETNKSTIIGQIKATGASIDWSRYAYTMDAARYRAVMVAFVNMYKEGLIYRGNRVVNWDPKAQTVISDDEIEYEERDAKLYTFKYWSDFPIEISTTRPETKVGDTAVAVHPEDERYKKYIGKEFTGDFAGAKLSIRVVSDYSVEKDFGTGALGVTPAHSHVDWEIADRNKIESRPQVIDEHSRMTEAAGDLVKGSKVLEARDKIVEWLKAENLISKEEDIKQNVSVAQRSRGIVEPLPKLQWFINVEKDFSLSHSEISGVSTGSKISLKELMRKSVSGGQIKILPERFEKTYFNWIDNLRPWCISRQIWFGHRIPIWYRAGEIFCGLEAPNGDGWQQDPDVLDTWFSSALWTFSTLGWPDKTDDLKVYHPTSVLETGYDIIFFWVARMILMSGYHLGQVPFKTVYLHGLVRDGQGRKISKSLGNNIDPLEMIAKYGTDAMRMSLIAGMGPGADSKMSEEKIKAYKHFANKLWNITRFITENQTADDNLSRNVKVTVEDQKIIDDFNSVSKEISSHLNEYRLHLAVEQLYTYIWHTFADIIIEQSKSRLKSGDETVIESTRYTLRYILENCLKLLHPFMPFITEEIWQTINSEPSILMVEEWPKA